MAVSSFSPRATKICLEDGLTSETSSHATHGTGGAPNSVEPPKINGRGTARSLATAQRASPPPRSCPACCHKPVSTLKRLANTCDTFPKPGLGSDHVIHGTARFSPATVMIGKSATTLV